MFLPGIEASRLYEKISGLGDYKLWEPIDSIEDLKRLYLDSEGNSINNGIYTKDILNKFYGIVDIYDGFTKFMNDLVEEKTIEEWKAVPYDWRLPLDQTIDKGVKLKDDKIFNITEEVEKLAQNSKSGKVTIIGHSNGGLLGKVLINKLKENGKADLVDKFIMVGTPQLGTPKAMAGLLHGDKLDIPMILSKSMAKTLAENMSSAYNLLPSKKYFDYVQTPVIEFEDDVKDIYGFKKIYGSKIDSKDELDKFLLGDDGKRSDPNFGDNDSPNVLNDKLLGNANKLHDERLDNWNAPNNVKVIQIAGWGLDTVSGIKYDDCDIVFCPDKLSNLDRELIFKKDGDKTVVVPSAVAMGGGEIYYVNIGKYNSYGQFNINREHSSILAITSVQDFIDNILSDKNELPKYITKEKPEVADDDESLRYRMHSPVAVHLYEDDNHTGIIENSNSDSDIRYYEENIPNSYYLEFGETKYLGSPKDDNIKIELVGEDTGTFTFEIDKLNGETIDNTIVFQDIPVLKDMKAYVDISGEDAIMDIDWNNDNKIDIQIDTADDSNEIASIKILEEIIKESKINPILKKHFLNEIKVAEKQIKKGKTKIAGKILEILEKQIEMFSDKRMFKKFRIDKNEAESLIKIIETVRLNLIR